MTNKEAARLVAQIIGSLDLVETPWRCYIALQKAVDVLESKKSRDIDNEMLYMKKAFDALHTRVIHLELRVAELEKGHIDDTTRIN